MVKRINIAEQNSQDLFDKLTESVFEMTALVRDKIEIEDRMRVLADIISKVELEIEQMEFKRSGGRNN